MGGSGSGSTEINKMSLPDYAQDEAEAYLARAWELSQEAYATFSGTTYANQNADELEGISKIATRGRNSHEIITKGETYLRDVLDGLKLTNNPKITDVYLERAERIIREFEEDVLPRIDHIFNASGSYGSDAHHLTQVKEAEKVMARLAEIGMDSFFNDYLEERTYQTEALGVAIEYGTQDIVNAELLRQAGLYAREYTQGAYEDAYKKWIDEQTWEVRRLEIIGNAIRALVGAQSKTTTPYYRMSPIAQIAGIALAGASIISIMGGSENTKYMNQQGFYSDSMYPNTSGGSTTSNTGLYSDSLNPVQSILPK